MIFYWYFYRYLDQIKILTFFFYQHRHSHSYLKLMKERSWKVIFSQTSGCHCLFHILDFISMAPQELISLLGLSLGSRFTHLILFFCFLPICDFLFSEGKLFLNIHLKSFRWRVILECNPCYTYLHVWFNLKRKKYLKISFFYIKKSHDNL